MKELTLAEAIEALKAGKKVRLNQNGSTPFWLDENRKFRFDNYDSDKMAVSLGKPDLCSCICDFEEIVNKKRFILVEEPILDEEEKRYLGNIIKPFRKKYPCMVIQKYSATANGCYIRIILLDKHRKDECYEEIDLPYFNEGNMYKGMVADREYTLEELDL